LVNNSSAESYLAAFAAGWILFWLENNTDEYDVRGYMKNPIIIILLVIAVVLSVGCGNSGIEGYYATQDPNNKESFVPYSALYNFKPDYVCEYFAPRVNSDDRGSKLVGS